MTWKPNVTVAAVICRDDKYLLVEEDADYEVVFNQPAGHLEENETLVDAVIREVMEETAWEFVPQSVTGIYLYTSPKVGITYLRVCFAGVVGQHYPGNSLDDGILRTVWMSREELEANRYRTRSPLVIRCIDDYISGKEYPLDILSNIN